MVATLCLLGCVLAPGQSPDRAPPAPNPAARGAWTLAPTFTRSQELVYRGHFTEECRGGRVQFDRSYRVEPGTENHPASGISYQQAVDYCAWLSNVSGRRYRYLSVPRAIYEEMRRSPSKGEFFNSRIRDRFEFERLDS